MDEDDDETCNCPVCFETFQQKGEHIPREIPCGGHLCENCIKELLDDRDVLDCPECGLEHFCPEGIKSFPTAWIFDGKRNATDETAIPSNVQNCKEHDTEASIYCQEPFCRKAVQSLRTDEVADDLQEETQNGEADDVLEEGEIVDEEEEFIIPQKERTEPEHSENARGTVSESEPADTKKNIRHEENRTNNVAQLNRKHPETTKLNLKARPPITTELSCITFMIPLGANSVIVCGEKEDGWVLARFNLGHQGAVRTAALDKGPDGMTRVGLAGNACVVLSYMDDMKIEFRYMSKVTKTVYNCVVSPHRPGRLSSLSTTTPFLLYENQSLHMREVHWLDCTTSPPVVARNPSVTHAHQGQILDMCSAETNGSLVIITTRDVDGGIYSYNAKTSKLLWTAVGRYPGMKKNLNMVAVTTDQKGHIFACDNSNSCIQMFTIDGTYLGAMPKCREVSVQQSSLICWCKKSSFLVLSFPKNGQYYISKIEDVEEEDAIKEEKINVKRRRESSSLAATEKEVDEFLREVTVSETEEPSRRKRRKQGSRKNTHLTPEWTPARSAAVEVTDRTPVREKVNSVQGSPAQNDFAMERPPDPIKPVNTEAKKRPSQGPSDEAPAGKRKRLDDNIKLGSFKYTVVRSFSTGCTRVHHMCLLGARSIYICGTRGKKEKEEWKLIRYSTESKKEFSSATLKHEPSGMAIVKVEGKTWMAVSYTSPNMMEYRSPNKLETVLYQQKIAWGAPGRLFQAHPSTLLCVNKNRRRMHWIDCSNKEHKILSVTRTSHIDIQDMCIVDQDCRQILVTSNSFAGLNAYDVTSGVVSWSVIGRPPDMAEELCSVGVTNDKQGHLLVCDSSNKCIHIFSTDGNYLGPILKNHLLGSPYLVRWHEKHSLLVVATMMQSDFHIGLIKLMFSNNGSIQTAALKDRVVGAKSPDHIKCKALRNHTTGLMNVSYMSTVGSDRVAVCTRENTDWRMLQYSTAHGGKLKNAMLKEAPSGITDIKLGETLCVVLSYTESSTLEFYDANNFKTTVLTYSMAFRNPGVICTAAPSVLLYEDKANSPREVHWLDCSSSPPKPSGGTNVTRTKEGHIWSMCYVQRGEKHLLITTGAVGIYAYDTKSNCLEWSFTDKLPGNLRKMSPQSVTTDHKGHVFISDSNSACVQMFSGADGKYMGALLKSESYRLSCICWNTQYSSMIVARTKNNYCDLTTVRISENKAERLKNKSSPPKRLVSVSTKTPARRSSSTTFLAAKSVLSKAMRNVVEKSLRKSTDTSQVEQTPLTKRTLLFSRPPGMMNTSRVARSKAPSWDGDRDTLMASVPKTPLWKKSSRMKTTPPWQKVSKPKTTPPWKKSSGTKSSSDKTSSSKAESYSMDARPLGPGTMTALSSSKTSLWSRSTSRRRRSKASRTVTNATATKSVTPPNTVTVTSSENNKPSGTKAPTECIVIDDDPSLKSVSPSSTVDVTSSTSENNKPSGTEAPTECIVIDDDPPVVPVTSARAPSATKMPNDNSAGLLSLRTGPAQVPFATKMPNDNSAGLLSLRTGPAQVSSTTNIPNDDSAGLLSLRTGPAQVPSTTKMPNDNSAGLLSLRTGPAQVPSCASTRNANSDGFLDIPHGFIPLNRHPAAWMTAAAMNNMFHHPLGLRPLNVPPRTNIHPPGFALVNTPDCVTGLITDATHSTVQPPPIQPPEYEVAQSIGPQYVSISNICVLPYNYPNSVVVCGLKNSEWEVTQYNVTKGKSVASAVLERQPSGLTAVGIRGKSHLVITYPGSKEIYFRDAKDLNKIVLRFSTDPHTPERICWCSPNQVVFLCATGSDLGEVRQLQCGSFKPTRCNSVAHVNLQRPVHDMCCIKLDCVLLVVTHGEEGVYAYNLNNDHLAWCVKGKLPGMQRNISAEGITVAYPSAHCCVCDDKNSAVHLLSSTGEYMGSVLNAFQGVGAPWRIRFSSVLDSLFVTFINKQGRHQVAKFKPVKDAVKRGR